MARTGDGYLAAFNSVVEAVHIGNTGSAFIVNSKGKLQSSPRVKLATNIVSLLRMLSQAGGGEAPQTLKPSPGACPRLKSSRAAMV